MGNWEGRGEYNLISILKKGGENDEIVKSEERMFHRDLVVSLLLGPTSNRKCLLGFSSVRRRPDSLVRNVWLLRRRRLLSGDGLRRC